jgi:hypothetical protein
MTDIKPIRDVVEPKHPHRMERPRRSIQIIQNVKAMSIKAAAALAT